MLTTNREEPLIFGKLKNYRKVLKCFLISRSPYSHNPMCAVKMYTLTHAKELTELYWPCMKEKSDYFKKFERSCNFNCLSHF